MDRQMIERSINHQNSIESLERNPRFYIQLTFEKGVNEERKVFSTQDVGKISYPYAKDAVKLQFHTITTESCVFQNIKCRVTI